MLVCSTSEILEVQELINARIHYGCFLLYDENTIKYCDNIIRTQFPMLNDSMRIIIPAGESNKSIEKCQIIWDNLVQFQANKKSLLILVGGGVITDIGGFSAACFKRGIDFINIPTTLLGMVDASIGGKTGVNFRHTKNQVGVFAEAKCVYINPLFLNSLPGPQLRSGLAEMIKHELLFNKNALDVILEKPHMEYWVREESILKSMYYKQVIVEQDYLDKGLRQCLNFGHTIGHAIEALSHKQKKTILHGEAILLGMIAELKVSEKLYNCPEEIRHLLEDVKKKYFPMLDFKYNMDQLIPYLLQDKKNDDQIRFSLIKDIAEPVLQVAVNVEELKNVLA